MSVRQGASGPLVEEHEYWSITGLDTPNAAQDGLLFPIPAPSSDSLPDTVANTQLTARRASKKMLARRLSVQQRAPATTGTPLTGRLVTYKLVTISDDFATLTDTLLTLDVDATDGDEATVFLTAPVAIAEGQLYAIVEDHPALGAAGTDTPTNIVADLELLDTGLA